MTTPHKVPYNDREYYGNSLMIYDGRAAADSWYSMNYQIGGYTPSIGNVTYRNYYASVYAYGNTGYNVFDVTPTFNPGVHTPDTCFELLSIESTRWKVVHDSGVTVGGHGIRVTDIPLGVGV